ncbi:MAG TPA: glycosyltransferase [Bacteroidales bacterium]|nr:glycosyltransferase [Bacteroidales bacterium]
MRKIVMIGKQYDTLFLELAKEYRFAADKILLVSRYRGTMSDYSDEHISYVPTIEHEGILFRINMSILIRILKIFLFPYRLIKNNKKVYGIIDPIIQALSVSKYVNKLNDVYFVSAHSIFTYGLSSILCKKHIRVLRPWGGDVYQTPFNSGLHYKLIKYVLKKADIVDASTPTLYDYLKLEFDLKNNLVLNEARSYMGQAEVISVKNKYSKETVREELNLPKDKIIIANCRRFKEKWGSEEVFKAFNILAEKHDNLHFILLSGTNSEEKISMKKEILKQNNLISRFTIYENNVDLEMYAKIIYSSDIFFSLMHNADLRSASILTGMHCESLPIISDMPEYREMIRSGASIQLVPFNDMEEIVKGCERYLEDNTLKKQTLAANSNYILGIITGKEPFADLIKRVDELKIQCSHNI